MKMKFRKFVCLVCVMTMLLPMCLTLSSLAAENELSLEGKVFTVDDDEFVYDESKAFGKTGKNNTAGAISLIGDLQKNDTGSPVSYNVNSGEIQLTYNCNNDYLSEDNTKWHIVESKTKKVNDIELSNNMQKGVIIIQVSFDNDKWTTVSTRTNYYSQPILNIYAARKIQLENGCFYRIIVGYKLEKKTGEKKIGPLTTDIIDAKYVVEEYSFYAKNKNTESTTSTPATTPRKELGSTVSAGKKEDFYNYKGGISGDDPHFGWPLGTFVMNGYTSETTENGIPVFLKNVGDKVTLWFTLLQDIQCLNGKENLSIAEDDNAKDEKFGEGPTNFKRGALLIKNINNEGSKNDIIRYYDFLAADAVKGANTKVELFEEGDYEVTLDYSIKNTPRKIGSIEIVPTYTYYKINFSFKIRNGNCMVFPRDLITTSELSNQSLAPNGFYLDMTNSKYLSINVKKSVLKRGVDGRLVEDVRFNQPAADNEKYTDEGIYTFTVKNRYTNEEVTKRIYIIKSDKYLLALSNNDITIDALNDMLTSGATISETGALIVPTSETETTEVEETSIENTSIAETTTESVSVVAPEDNSEKNGSSITKVVPLVVIIFIAAVVIIIKKRKK